MYEKCIKRLVDIILSGIGIVLLIIPDIIINIAILIQDGMPTHFSQRRYGINKTLFNMYKFRSMRNDAPHDVATHLLDDPEKYLTTVGRFIRKTSLDELPQVFNIFLGKMSIVGPRPALWNQDDLIELRDKYGANNVRPGLTGWAQVNGRDELSLEEKAKYDGEYAKNISFLFDVRIFFMTILVVLKKKGNIEGGTGTVVKMRQRAQKNIKN